MIVMPANATGVFWNPLARETGKIGHLYSPGGQRGPWPWFPYALDNGAFPCWNQGDNSFSEEKWNQIETSWRHLLFWTQVRTQKPRWAIVPDRPGNWGETCLKWSRYAGTVEQAGIPLAVAVQEGATPESVRALFPSPAVIAVGGGDDWKWGTVEMWAREFPRVHLLRCNSPAKLPALEAMGVESCDGTGWNRGDRKQTRGLEEWARRAAAQETHMPPLWPLWPHVCRVEKDKLQTSFA